MSQKAPTAHHASRISLHPVWLVPLIALLVAGWMLYQNWASQGPEITLIADNAEGLEVGKTKIKARNVEIGEVTAIQLSDNFEHAIITATLNQGSQGMLHKDTQFWVIKPRVGTEGISGLGTLLSGAYIEMEPGRKGEPPEHYTMLKQPPLSTAEDKGLRLQLFSTGLAKMSVGTPVHFRGYQVGHIESVGFDTEKEAITYRIFISAPYDALVSDVVQFWVTPGLSLKSSARGVEVRMDSLETLLTGGISFGTTKEGLTGQMVEDMSRFQLYGSKQDAADHRYTQFLTYVFMFDEDVGGLEAGAPIEFRGIRIGTVQQVPFKGIPLHRWNEMQHPAIPVLARIEPQRLADTLTQKDISLEQWQTLFQESIDDGLRASLNTRNLFTGAKVISLDFVDNSKQSTHTGRFADYPIFPSVPGGFADMEQKLTAVLDNLGQAPLEETFKTLNQTLKQADHSLASIHAVSHELQQLLAKPETQQLPASTQQLLQQMNQTLSSYQPNGGIGQQLGTTLTTLQRTLDDLQPLIRQLGQQPNALIFEGEAPPDRIPSASSEPAPSRSQGAYPE
ncbi:mammalian cell entry protein [Terasakiispira papahanaumokuakeensis]|uniref:Mammalian cell entry protein n=1 Tax=Terasakiispira papahanaumokuakeensis TaxID=197479 RepID=A0A1E2VC49_9GAMM|nr:intermembrane transport protein PqiB [Terasakiispira papahanaumokuakeensis]ODC04396.1 mammalian cell entry protein [Terasakiispira papahanaumokuakeensis]